MASKNESTSFHKTKRHINVTQDFLMAKFESWTKDVNVTFRENIFPSQSEDEYFDVGGGRGGEVHDAQGAAGEHLIQDLKY